jgi:uncharacterized protein
MLPSQPDRVDPWRFAELGKELAGRVGLMALDRLAPSLLGGGDAVYRLRFGVDAEGRAVVEGHVEADLLVGCQRCLGAMVVPVVSRFALAFVRGLDEANALPEHYEPAWTEDGLVRPVDLIEDELILCLPAVPLHPEGECVPPSEAGAVRGERAQASPFAILASLRSKGDASTH